MKKMCSKETACLGRVFMCYGEKVSILHPRLTKMKRNINSDKEHRYYRSIKVRYVRETWRNFNKASQLNLEVLTLAADKETGYRKRKRGKHSEENQLCERVSIKRKSSDKEVL
jgi:hypothetical protein